MRYTCLLFIFAMIQSCADNRPDGDSILGVWVSEVMDSEMGELMAKVTIDESNFKMELAVIGDEGIEGFIILEGHYSYKQGDIELTSSVLYELDEQREKRIDGDNEEHGTFVGTRYSIELGSDHKLMLTDKLSRETIALTKDSSDSGN